MLENYKYAEYDQRQYIKGCPYIIPWYNKNEESWQKGPTLTMNENRDLYWLSQRNANKQYTTKGICEAMDLIYSLQEEAKKSEANEDSES